MESDIQFGEFKEEGPRPQLRPDRNRHYAVAAVDAPTPQDLPIYIDLDVLRDIETHALSDTSVELGGVLLGGQFVDDEGAPFVVISDSLRAEHYHATKGSFKFTHETWEQITRQREEFPPDLQMVGWYHTHPDWGVFLSGMDMFICNNFFNRPLDVALVVDPCRGDRGMFTWTGQPRQPIRRADGFFVIASRFREAELVDFAEQLGARPGMPTTTRVSSSTGHVGPAPVVHIHNDRGGLGWAPLAVAGGFAAQFALLALLAWRVLAPGAPPPADEEAQARFAAVAEALQELSDRRREAERTQAQAEVLDRVIVELKLGKANFVENLTADRQENEQLKQDLSAYRHAESLLEERHATLTRAHEKLVAASKSERESLTADIADLRERETALKKTNATNEAQIKTLAEQLEALRQPAGKGTADPYWAFLKSWPGIATVGGVLLLLVVGAVAAYYYWPSRDRDGSDSGSGDMLRDREKRGEPPDNAANN